ncbi:MAG: hypothetical protein IIW86_04570, partial [Clostridia bacterium]|nr:hypothetical protein [Clostridia bacterium]
MRYVDFLHFLLASVIAILLITIPHIFSIHRKKFCKNCANKTPNGCRIITWTKEFNVNNNCGFYREEGGKK